jgi:hypothetical protein
MRTERGALCARQVELKNDTVLRGRIDEVDDGMK